MSTKKFNVRSLTAFIVAWAFLVAIVSGVVLYVVPHGRVAYWVNWKLVALTKDGWANMHIVFGAIFIVAGLVHLYYNWKPFRRHFSERVKGHVHLRKELVASVVISVAVMVAAIANAPPVSWLYDLNAITKASWVSSPDFEPPYGHAEETSLAGFARRQGMDLNVVVAELKAQNLTFDGPRDSLEKIALANGMNAMELYRLIKKFEPAPEPVALEGAISPVEIEAKFSGTGIGRKTLSAMCDETGLAVADVGPRLDTAGLAWKADQKMKAIGEENGVSPIEVLKVMLVAGYQPQKP